MLQDLHILFQRDLDRLRNEISSYSSETLIWKVIPGTANPGGNICLHLLGNLHTYIGKELGGTGYIRNRDLEFSARGLSQAELLQKIDGTALMMKEVLPVLDEKLLNQPYPAPVFDQPMTTGYFLLHLLAHFNYHLGQINYHRRISASA